MAPNVMLFSLFLVLYSAGSSSQNVDVPLTEFQNQNVFTGDQGSDRSTYPNGSKLVDVPMTEFQDQNIFRADEDPNSSKQSGEITAATNKLQQAKFIRKAAIDCVIKMNITKKPQDGLYCDMVFDNVMCWDYTRAGVLSKQSCPGYISGFIETAEAEKQCSETGKWYIHPRLNSSWTNFRPCTKSIIYIHLPKITLLARVGYSVSLALLLFAVFIMIYFRKLHCQRNTIHINLFLSCILRASICLLKEFVIIQGLGLEMDLEYNDLGNPTFKSEGTHWQCKLIFTMFHYAICTNYMWVFVEGLYLHNLIFFTVFNIRKLYLILYILLGWLSPFLIIVPWIVVRVLKENTLCWNTGHNTAYFWILRGPIIASICINFFFFLNIIRVLFTKLMTSITREPLRYRKLAKSTLVLIPLFGVQYILFVALTTEMNPEIEVVKLYMEMLFNSFQGAIVALLFCFLNGEVKSEIRKVWRRHMIRRTSTCSRPFNTSSSFMGRDRGGSEVQQPMVAMVDINSEAQIQNLNGDVKNKNKEYIIGENGDLHKTNTVSENTSLIKTEDQGEQLQKNIQSSMNSENSSLLCSDAHAKFDNS